MHRTVGLDWAQDSLRVATLQSGFRGFAIQDVRVAPLPAATPYLALKIPIGTRPTTSINPISRIGTALSASAARLTNRRLR